MEGSAGAVSSATNCGTLGVLACPDSIGVDGISKADRMGRAARGFCFPFVRL